MTRRDHNMTEKAAAFALAWLEARGEPIPREHVHLMTADQILSLFEIDHFPIRYENGGTTHPDNARPRFIREHRDKTAKIDKPASAKAKRLDVINAEHQRRLLAKDRGEPRPPSRWGTRKLQSRPFNRSGHG